LNTTGMVLGVCVVGEQALDASALAAATGVDLATLEQLVDEGLLVPTPQPPPWRFEGEAVARVRRITRLQRDFDANLQSVAVMLQLLDEIDSLRTQLLRAGITPQNR
jgi:chaperone modulatory protein CbpM